MLKTSAYGLGFQHLPRDLANVNAWKTMFDPYIERPQLSYLRTCYIDKHYMLFSFIMFCQSDMLSSSVVILCVHFHYVSMRG